MIQLKRFHFNPYTESNEKILERCSYPEHLEFSRWTFDQSGSDGEYDLYAVLVHEGSQASSGHYYIFVHL
jgi:ubiquitin carboxyl-terminal hydrolase 3